MKSETRYIWILGVLCAAAVLAMALLLPGARLSFLLPAAFAVGALSVLMYGHTRFYTPAGMMVIMAAYTLVVCGIIWNVNFYTEVSGGSYSAPVLVNNDARTDWELAVHRAFGVPLTMFDGFMGVRYYGYIIQGLIVAFGCDIGVPLIFNSLCYVLLLILIGAIAWQLTANRAVATATMAVGALMCYLMVQATVLIKDVPLTMCVAAAVLVMVKWHKGDKVSLSDMCLLAVALAGIAFLRANFLLMLLLGVALFSIRPGRNQVILKVDVRFIWLGFVVVAIFFVMHTFFTFPTVAENVDAHYGTGVFVHHQNVRAWDRMLTDDYEAMSIWRRLLWLPASVIVQFLIPFPWNFARDMIFGPTECVAHFGYFWYYAGAVLLYWIFALQRRSAAGMRLLVLWGVLLTVATAYMMSGRVSRYCLPYLPMLLPAVGWVLAVHTRRRSLWIWLGVFTVLLVPVLIVCHHLQSSAV